MKGIKYSTPSLTLLSEILLHTDSEQADASSVDFPLPQVDFSELSAVANSHHVVMRTFPALHQMAEAQRDLSMAVSLEEALNTENTRIQHALSFLGPICEALADVGQVIVIKSLDHWPDLGSDLDLYSNAEGAAVVSTMGKRFRATLAERSWGDRLANKWNFVVPGLPELVEVHVGRLGQTGEHVALAQSLVNRAQSTRVSSYEFPVPAAEERLIISTLQRMYRHFYIRLCDIVDNARLIESATVNYTYLSSLSQSAGVWDGLATYLRILSDYVQLYRGEGLALPELVTSAARFGAGDVFFKRNFIRIPLVPHSASLYASELTRLLRNGDMRSSLRLSLLPGLATAAAVELKLTGSDKGIW